MSGATMIPLDYALITVATVLILAVSWHRRSKNLPLPPGPPGLPIVGNVYDIPKHESWVAYKRWSQEFNSDIIHLNLAGTSMIVINSAKAAHDLLEKRSTIYSDRPRMTMINELVGWGWNFAFMHYGDDWKERRRMFVQHFSPNAVTRYRPRTLQCAHELIVRMLDDPDTDFIEHLRLQAGSIILNLVYGLDIRDKDNPHLTLAETAVHSMAVSGLAGSWLVDSFPLLKYVPTWFPLAGFRRQARRWRNFVDAMVEVPFKAVKQSIVDGGATTSVTASLLSALDTFSDGSKQARQESVISYVAGAAYAGGADTSVSTLGTFFLAMLLFPEIQRKGQEEIDCVVEKDRLPDYSDQASLPYVTAIVKEVLRWRQVLPVAVPRCLEADDIYNGYHLPAGALIIGNSWAILHDEDVYPEPNAFKPERFLTSDGQLNPDAPEVEYAFGFGRRTCPGRHLAAASLWITAATVLATLDVKKPVDSQGRYVEPSGEYTDGMLSYPVPFKCMFKPRSSAAEALVRASAEQYK